MAKVTVNAKEILADIKAGMDDTTLAQKHGLSDKELQRVFKQLADAGRLKQGESEKRIIPLLTERLMEASLRGNSDVAELLLAKGADINAKDDHGFTALMWAVVGGHFHAVKLLLDKGADINAKNNNGQTALMHAALGGEVDAVKLLLDKGADINAKDKDGDTSLMLIPSKAHHEVVELLKAHGAT